MRHLCRIIINEYRAVFTDPGVIMIFVAGMLIYAMVYPLPYSNQVLKEVAIAPLDQDGTAMSRKLMRWLEATEEIHLTAPARDLSDARQRVLNGEANGIFVIPSGFERTVLRGEQATVSVYCDASYFLLYRQVATGAMKATATLSAGIEVRRHTAAGLAERQAMTARDPIPIVSRALFNPAGGYATYVVPGVLMLILQQTLLIAVGMLGGTRTEQANQNPTPAAKKESPLVLLVGQGIAYFGLYMTYPIFYLSVVYPVYNLPRIGDALVALAFIAPFILAVIYLGLSLNAIFVSRELSIPALLYTSMPAVFLIGFAWPLEAIPAWLRNLALLLPSTCGSAGFLRINQMNATLREVQFEWFTLWALAALYFTLAWLVLVHRNRRAQQATKKT